MKTKPRKPRSAQVQLNRMRHRWPDLRPRMLEEGRAITWIGPLRGFQMKYEVAVIWEWQNPKAVPVVHVLDPPIEPRPGPPHWTGRIPDILLRLSCC